MEEAKWDEANVEKVRLEEKQRANRRKREIEAEQATSEGTLTKPNKCFHSKVHLDEDSN